MRSLQRRKQDIWVTKATRSDASIEGTITYSKPEHHRCSVSNTSGSPGEVSAGIIPEYDRYIISYDRDFKPEEGSMLFVDKTPILTASGNLAVDINGDPYSKPDYVLVKISNTEKGTIARFGIRKIAGNEQ